MFDNVRTYVYNAAMKNEMTVTELRSNIYAVIDDIIRTGEPVNIRKNNQLVTISVPKKKAKPKKKKIINDLSKIKTIPDLLVEDAEFYRSIDWASLVDIWNPDANI